jgi:hypothetical protein
MTRPPSGHKARGRRYADIRIVPRAGTYQEAVERERRTTNRLICQSPGCGPEARLAAVAAWLSPAELRRRLLEA